MEDVRKIWIDSFYSQLMVSLFGNGEYHPTIYGETFTEKDVKEVVIASYFMGALKERSSKKGDTDEL